VKLLWTRCGDSEGRWSVWRSLMFARCEWRDVCLLLRKYSDGAQNIFSPKARRIRLKRKTQLLPHIDADKKSKRDEGKEIGTAKKHGSWAPSPQDVFPFRRSNNFTFYDIRSSPSRDGNHKVTLHCPFWMLLFLPLVFFVSTPSRNSLKLL